MRRPRRTLAEHLRPRGYETLLDTDMKRKLDQMNRLLNLAVEYKTKISFPRHHPHRAEAEKSTKHQSDRDLATVSAFLRSYGRELEVKLNLEQDCEILADHCFGHEISRAATFGIPGSLDVDRGDDPPGQDADPFPNNVRVQTLAVIGLIKAARALKTEPKLEGLIDRYL